MARSVRAALIQATLCEEATAPVQRIKENMIEKHVALIDQAAGDGAEIVCLQELFYGPYFPAEQEIKWRRKNCKIPKCGTAQEAE